MMGIARKIASRAIAPSGTDVFLVEGGRDASGKKAWYFVRIHGAKTRAFQQAAKQGVLNLLQFGEILASGFGASPSDSIVDHMRLYHGYKGEA